MIIKKDDLWVYDGIIDDEEPVPAGYRNPTLDELISLVRKELGLQVEESWEAYRYVTPWQYRRERT